MTTVLIDGYKRDAQGRTRAEVATGIRPRAVSQVLSVGATLANSGFDFDSDIARAKKEIPVTLGRGQTVVLWLSPGTTALDKGAIDFNTIATSDDAKKAMEIAHSIPVPFLVRLCYGIHNWRQDMYPKPGVPGSRRYVSPAGAIELWETWCAMLPAHAIPTLCFEPHGGSSWWQFVPPTVSQKKRTVLIGSDYYFQQDFTLLHQSGKVNDAIFNYANEIGQPCGTLEGGCSWIDVKAPDAGLRFVTEYCAPYWKKALKHKWRTFFFDDDTAPWGPNGFGHAWGVLEEVVAWYQGKATHLLTAENLI